MPDQTSGIVCWNHSLLAELQRNLPFFGPRGETIQNIENAAGTTPEDVLDADGNSYFPLDIIGINCDKGIIWIAARDKDCNFYFVNNALVKAEITVPHPITIKWKDEDEESTTTLDLGTDSGAVTDAEA